MTKTLLIVSGGVEAADAAKRAKELGYTVVVSDRDPEAPGFAFADSCLIADVYSPEETSAAAERYHRKIRKIDGAICVAADAPMTVAAVLERLGLPGLSMESARLASDKLAMKERFKAAACPCRGSRLSLRRNACTRIAIERGAQSGDQARRQPRQPRRPAHRRGGRPRQSLHARHSHSPTQRVMVEQYLDGPQVSTESVVVEGHCFTPGFSDRNYEYLERYAPFFIENGGDLPSHLPRGDASESPRRRGKRGGCTRHRQRHRQGRHRRPQGRALRDRTGGAAFGRLLLHARNSAQHRRRFRRRGHQDCAA